MNRLATLRDSLLRWARRQPVLFGAAVLAIALIARPTFRAADRILFATFPPSLTGHWESTDEPILEFSLSANGDKIEGVGQLRDMAFTVKGVGTARGANLVFTAPATQAVWPVSIVAHGRRGMTVTFRLSDGTPVFRDLRRE
jgi:hypothetical protein